MSIHYSAINHQYVSIICEEQGYLVYDELPMKINQSLLNRIHDYVNNENYTLLDLQNLVIQNGFIREYTSEYAHLFAYQDSYIDINKHVKINILTEDEYYRSIPKYKSEKYLKQLNQTQKESFAKDVLRGLYAAAYRRVTRDIKIDSSIRLHSTESIGWDTFAWNITEDIDVLVKTNFCYGSASYLNVAIKYKDCLLTPLSDYITYYYARAESFIKCTRRYIPTRDNWKKLIMFVIQFSNMITSSRDDFIQSWLIDEFRSMISGLNDFCQNTDFYLKSIRPTKEEKYLKVYNVDAFSNYSCNITEEERGFHFVAEKLSGALLFVKNIFELTLYNDELLSYIKEVVNINNTILPTLNSKIESVECEVNKLKDTYNKEKTQLDKIEKQKSYWDKKAEFFLTKEERRKKDKFDYKESLEHFKVLFPKYQEIISLYQEQIKRYNSISAEYRGRSSFLSSLQKCKERIVNANNSYNNIIIPCVSTIK